MVKMSKLRCVFLVLGLFATFSIAAHSQQSSEQVLTADAGSTTDTSQSKWYQFFSKLNKTEEQKPAEPRRVNPYPIPKRIDIGHIEGKGIGYDKGYTDFSILLGPEYEVDHHVSLLDLRAAVFDDGTAAANAGIIVRMLPSKYCKIFGVNLFYDFREGKYGNFNQISGGFEILHRRWEMHINAQVPLATKQHHKRCVFDNYIGGYREVCKLREFAEQFYDVNFGYYLAKGKNFQLYAGAGPYYLNGHGKAWGGRTVVRPQFYDYFSVEFSVSYDHIYRTVYQANAVFTIPLYNYSSAMKHKSGPCSTTNRQIYQPINRTIALMEGSRKCHQNWPN